MGMLHEKPVLQYDPPAGAGDDGLGDGKEVWTGQKRQKHETTPSDPSDEMSEDDVVSDVEFEGYLAVLATRKPPLSITGHRLDAEQQRKVHERLAFCRIRASRLEEGVSMDELDDATLRKEFSPQALKELDYFDQYEKADSVDWYFRHDHLSDLGDYQRLILKDGLIIGGSRFLDWEKYSWFTSYEMDEEYLKLYEELSMKIKWIKHYLVTCKHSSPELLVKQNIAFRQAVKIAAGFCHMNYDTTFLAYTDHMWNVVFNYVSREDHDLLYFEIWKRVTEQKAVLQAPDPMQLFALPLSTQAFEEVNALILLLLSSDSSADDQDLWLCIWGNGNFLTKDFYANCFSAQYS